MPDYFSHSIAAEKIYERLDSGNKEKIESKTLYMLGAQGADVFFAYSAKLTKNNLGRSLHRWSAEALFEKLNECNPSYVAGFATHYALDSTLHPAVYAYESGKRSPFAHQRFESDLGLYISKFYHIRRTILPREKVLACTSPVYDSIKLLEPSVTVTGVERCLKRHFNYTRYLFNTKKQTYKCDFDFSSLAGSVEEAVELGVSCVKSVLSHDIDGAIFSKEFLQR
ncbi:MAG: hypothetical protein HDP34_02640 [Clostridia bacterium]|nr:hypothetical protein [Clostridia bacterium]